MESLSLFRRSLSTTLKRNRESPQLLLNDTHTFTLAPSPSLSITHTHTDPPPPALNHRPMFSQLWETFRGERFSLFSSPHTHTHARAHTHTHTGITHTDLL